MVYYQHITVENTGRNRKALRVGKLKTKQI